TSEKRDDHAVLARPAGSSPVDNRAARWDGTSRSRFVFAPRGGRNVGTRFPTMACMFHQPRHRAPKARHGTVAERVALAVFTVVTAITVRPVVADETPADQQPAEDTTVETPR